MPPASSVMKRSGPLVPSTAQRRLLFVDRLRGGRSAEYVRSAAVRLSGPLDRDTLCRAIQTIVERHEALRTFFTDVDGEPLQVVADGWQPPIAIEDLSGSSEEQR